MQNIKEGRIKGGVIMATSSITKNFVLTGDKACEKFANLLNNPAPQRNKSVQTYERGAETLKRRWSNLKN